MLRPSEKKIRLSTFRWTTYPDRDPREVIRLTNSLDAKAKAHIRHVKDHKVKVKVKGSLAFVIALSPFPTLLAQDGIFGVDESRDVLRFVYGRKGRHIKSDGTLTHYDYRPSILKGTKDISLSSFLPWGHAVEEFRHVSAVLYSVINPCIVGGYPWPEAIVSSQFVLAHNMNATVRLAERILSVGEEYVAEGTEARCVIRNVVSGSRMLVLPRDGTGTRTSPE
jgi:hypothetical protein